MFKKNMRLVTVMLSVLQIFQYSPIYKNITMARKRVVYVSPYPQYTYQPQPEPPKESSTVKKIVGFTLTLGVIVGFCLLSKHFSDESKKKEEKRVQEDKKRNLDALKNMLLEKVEKKVKEIKEKINSANSISFEKSDLAQQEAYKELAGEILIKLKLIAKLSNLKDIFRLELEALIELFTEIVNGKHQGKPFFYLVCIFFAILNCETCVPKDENFLEITEKSKKNKTLVSFSNFFISETWFSSMNQSDELINFSIEKGDFKYCGLSIYQLIEIIEKDFQTFYDKLPDDLKKSIIDAKDEFWDIVVGLQSKLITPISNLISNGRIVNFINNSTKDRIDNVVFGNLDLKLPYKKNIEDKETEKTVNSLFISKTLYKLNQKILDGEYNDKPYFPFFVVIKNIDSSETLPNGVVLHDEFLQEAEKSEKFKSLMVEVDKVMSKDHENL